MALPPAAREEACEAAREARRRLGTGIESRVPDLLEVIEETAGIPVFIEPLPDGMFGAYRRRPEGAFILLSSGPALVRQRFTLAHEYGHHVLGHGSVVDTNETLTDFKRDPMEVTANYFASEFLAPVRAVENWMEARHTPEPDLEVVVRLAVAFGISAQAARIRLEAARFLPRPVDQRKLDEAISAGEHTYLFHRLGLNDVADELVRVQQQVPRKPAKLQASVLTAYEEGFVGLERAADILAVSPTELRRTLDERGIETLDDEPDFTIDDSE